MKKFLALLCCAVLITGCSKDTSSTEGTETVPAAETAAEAATEPAVIYETRTVSLCTGETMTQYESGAVFVTKYAYDEYGRIAESWQQKDDGSKSGITVYAYDAQGNNTERVYNGSVRYEMTYDEAGQLLSQTCTNADGDVTAEDHYTYNEQGLLTEEVRITRYSGDRTVRCTFTYNEDQTQVRVDQTTDGVPSGFTLESRNALGQPLVSENYDAAGGWKSTFISTYDEAGHLILERKSFRADTQADYDVIYTYDHAGNLLSKNADYYYGHLIEYGYETFEIQSAVK